MDADARRRVTQPVDKGAKRQATRQNVDTTLATPLVSTPQPAPQPAVVPISPEADSEEKRKSDTETQGARVKRQAQINLVEAVHHIPFLNTAADVVDARAKAIQDTARIAEISVVDGVAGSSGDFDGLANAWGSNIIAPEVVQQDSTPQQLNIETPTSREI